jgi:hypothetical protein
MSGECCDNMNLDRPHDLLVHIKIIGAGENPIILNFLCHLRLLKIDQFPVRDLIELIDRRIERKQELIQLLWIYDAVNKNAYAGNREMEQVFNKPVEFIFEFNHGKLLI